MDTRHFGSREGGQVLPLFALGLVTLIAAIALVLDGGFALAKHRESQNASDAAAEAGAVVLAEHRSGADRTDSEVWDAVQGVLTAMGMDVVGSSAEYTRIDGTGLGLMVGESGGSASAPPPAAWGVTVNGSLPVDTFFARVIDIDEFDAATTATAITGYGKPAGTTLLPVTPPITMVTCDGTNRPLSTATRWGTEQIYKVPLCSNGAGNVGWLDWSDEYDENEGGGKVEIEDQIRSPYIPPPGILIPAWHQVAETGSPNKIGIEDALREHDGEIVLLPIFDAWCTGDVEPNSDGVLDCPEGDVSPVESPDPSNPGGGAKMWYHLQEIAAFELCSPAIDGCTEHGAYINSATEATQICESGNGSTRCLVGKFVNFIPGPGYVTGELDTTAGPSNFLVIQLIR